MPLRIRSDFKQALSTLTRLQQEAEEDPQVPLLQTPTMGGTQFIFYMVELARFMVDFLSFRKSRRRCTKYWVNGATCCLQYLVSFFGKILSWIQFILLQIDRLQLTAVYCNRRERCKDNTSNDPFSRCKCALIWLQIRIDDHRIQSGYKYKSELQNPEGKKSVLGITSAWWHRARHQWQRDYQGYCVWVGKPSTTPMTPRPRTPSTERTWTLTRECAVLLIVSQVLVVVIHTLHRLAQGCCACHLIHTWSVRFSFGFESSIPFYFLIFSFILYLLHFLLHFFHYFEGRSEPVHSASKGMDSLDDSYLRTGYEPNAYDFKETHVESYRESLTHPQFSKQGFLEDVEYDGTALEDMHREAHKVHVYHSQREDLSVCQSSSSMSERTGWLVGERTGRRVGPIGQELNVDKMSKQCWTRWTWTSEFQGYHVLLWSMRRVQAFENWFRKLRTTQIDMLFNKIYDKTKPATCCPESKQIIQDVGNVELFELLETDSKTQCKACLSYWNVGIVYCTCGHLLKEIVANRGVIEYTLDLPSIPEYVIEKGRPHGRRYGKLSGSREYYLANNLKKRCKKKDYEGIHDGFLRDDIFRRRIIENNRDEKVCRAWDVLADEDHTYHMSQEEYFY